MIERLRLEIRHLVASKYFGPLSTLAITLLGAILRFGNLANPHVLVFDETYYVKDAYTLGLFGFERNWPDEPNADFEAGSTDGYLDTAAYVVHPPIGKWVIYLGINLFGPASSFGWRFSVALLGTLAIPILIAVARRLIGSKVFAALAGLFLAIEGTSIVLARTAILDGVLAFFVLLGFYFLVRDQQAASQRLARKLLEGSSAGVSFRPWLFLSGIALGLATGTKWSGLYFVAAFGLFTLLSDYLSRKRLGISQGSLLVQAALNAITLVPVSIAVYVLGWLGWITTSGGWGRDAKSTWWESLFAYHQNALSFHVGLSTPHPYSSNAIGWLLNLRPTAFYYEKFEGDACGILNDCVVAITALPHPLIWAVGVIAILWILKRFLFTGELSAGLISVGFLAGWAPWIVYFSRTTFSFYSVVIAPFLMLALVYLLHRYWRRGFLFGRHSQRERIILWFVLLAMLLLGYFLSLWMGLPVPYWAWRIQMWFPFWI